MHVLRVGPALSEDYAKRKLTICDGRRLAWPGCGDYCVLLLVLVVGSDAAAPRTANR